MLSLTKNLISRTAALRSLSTTAAALAPRQWVVIAQDHNPEGVARRKEVRPAHMVRAKEFHAQGKLDFAGAILDSKDGETMRGSVLLVTAETEQEAREIIETDLYFTAKVWEKYTIHPFRVAFCEKVDASKQ
ncbi:hypothetical protein GQ42DRAFT_160503 [Ramicandelaber brevisporus]|nr:hypothetical protein GQ42DRAFT_160503 [Ramicandelaber brevisporus]